MYSLYTSAVISSASKLVFLYWIVFTQRPETNQTAVLTSQAPLLVKRLLHCTRAGRGEARKGGEGGVGLTSKGACEVKTAVWLVSGRCVNTIQYKNTNFEAEEITALV